MYVDENGIRFEHIHLIEIETGAYGPGWYYSDETGQLNGPYSTFREANAGLRSYICFLEGDRAE